MSSWEDPDELIVCPYDPVHRVQRKRLQYHLIKCRKNFYVKDYKVCPFNARHVVPKPEFDYHLQSCADRGRFEAEQLKSQTTRDPHLKGNTSIPAFDPSWRPESTESWDDDNVVYVPPVTDTLVSGGRPAQESRPSLPTQPERPRPLPATQRDTVEEPLQPRLPRLGGQTSSQVFQHSIAVQTSKMTSVGRGRGGGWSSVPATHTMPVGQTSQETVATPASVVKDPAEVEEERKKELYKRQRKLQKMLRQIQHLEEKGGDLTEEELTKVQKKQLILDQLEQLREAGITTNN